MTPPPINETNDFIGSLLILWLESFSRFNFSFTAFCNLAIAISFRPFLKTGQVHGKKGVAIKTTPRQNNQASADLPPKLKDKLQTELENPAGGNHPGTIIEPNARIIDELVWWRTIARDGAIAWIWVVK